MEHNVEKLCRRIENERAFLEHLVEDDLNSEKVIEQSQYVDELLSDFYQNVK